MMPSTSDSTPLSEEADVAPGPPAAPLPIGQPAPGLWTYRDLGRVLAALSQRTNWWPPHPPHHAAAVPPIYQLEWVPPEVLPMAVLLLIYGVRVSEIISLVHGHWSPGESRLRYMTRFRITRSFRVDPITASLIDRVCGTSPSPTQSLFQLRRRIHWSQVQVREILAPSLELLPAAHLRQCQQVAMIRLLYPEHRGSPTDVEDPCWRAVLTVVEAHLHAECPSPRGFGGHRRFKGWAGFSTYTRIALLRQQGVEAWWQPNRKAQQRGSVQPPLPFEPRQLAPVAEPSGQATAARRREHLAAMRLNRGNVEVLGLDQETQ